MATPVEWLNEFQVNIGTANNATAIEPKIIGLSNGRYLVAWRELGTTGVEVQAGDGIIGKIFNVDGSVFMDSFILNNQSSNDDERDFDIAATNDGGFIMVSMEDQISGGNMTELHWERFNASGNAIDQLVIAQENIAGDDIGNPQIAVNNNDNSSYVTFVRSVSGVEDDVKGVRIDSAGTIVAAEFDAAQNGADRNSDQDSAILTNGNLVTVYEETDGANVGIEFKIVNTAGANITTVNVTSGVTGDDPQVASLINGNFVVSWTEASDIMFRVYNSAGATITTALTAASGTNNQNESTIIALPDGDFVIAWDDDTAGNLQARRFNPTGTADGSTFLIESTGVTSPTLGVTGDGRILATWDDEGSNIFSSIWDPRSSTINTTDFATVPLNFVNADVVTSNIGSSTVNGDGGSDIILGQNGNDLLFGDGGIDTIEGGGGNDTIEGGFSTDSIDAGSGNDTIRIQDGQNIDNIDGGIGIDFLDMSTVAGANEAVNINLGTGVFTGLGGTTSINSVEDIIATRANDTLNSGNISGITLNASAGDDTVIGGAGTQTLFGGSGNDDITDGSGNDSVDGGSGNDTLSLISGTDNINMGSGDDLVFINENFIGDDTFDGGIGIDTLNFINSTLAAGTDIDLLSETITNSAGTNTETIIGFENVAGSQGSETISGTNGANSIAGDAGDDILRGRGGDDLLNGNEGDDQIIGGGGNDTANGGNENDFIDGQSGNDTLNGNAGDDTLQGRTGDDVLGGQAGNDTLTAGNGNDTLDGGSGDDTLSGQGDDDSLIGGAGNDVIFAGIGFDRVDGGSGNDTIFGAGNDDMLNGNVGDDSIAGGAGEDSIIGGNGNDNISAQPDNDTVSGGLGMDTIDGGNGDDVINGNEDADSLSGSLGNDILFGDEGNDNLNGGEGNDTIEGGTGNDTLNGSFGNDTLRGGDGDDSIQASSGADRLEGGAGFDTLRGGDGNDRLFGFNDDDSLFGDAGNDTLNGGGGDDILRGGTGSDTLTGAAGIDSFIFQTNFGSDTITDFDNGVEKIDLRPLAGVVNFNTDLNIFNFMGGAVIEYLPTGDTIFVANETAGSLTASDFLL